MKGIIFDLDGTMVDNMMVHHKVWQIKLREYGLDLSLDEVQQQIHGVNTEILKRMFGDRFTEEEREQLSYEKEAKYREVFKSELKLLDGLPIFLENIMIRNIPMGIGSAAPKENVDFVLETLDIRSNFIVALHSGDVEMGKPHPEIYHKVAERMTLSADQCVIFEDSPTGAKAASNAGAEVIVVTTTHEQGEFNGIPNISGFIKDFTKIDTEKFFQQFGM